MSFSGYVAAAQLRPPPKMSDTLFCAKCGAKATENARFCAHCGEIMKLAPKQTPPPAAAQPTSTSVPPASTKAEADSHYRGHLRNKLKDDDGECVAGQMGKRAASFRETPVAAGPLHKAGVADDAVVKQAEHFANAAKGPTRTQTTVTEGVDESEWD